MANFVRAANPIWFFVDLEGLPLNDEFWISFLENTAPFDPQPVFQDPQGMTPWTDPLQFYPNGTLPDNLYFDDSKVYRLEIRQGPLQSDPLIYEINNFIPDNGSGTATNSGSQENQISNPQFAFVDFTIQPSVNPSDKSLSITVAGTYQVGPDWFLALVGSGTATLTQIISTGDENIPSNPVPPYALKVETNGWSSATLYQRFNGVASIWANQFVSMSVLARSDNGIASTITLNYAPESPGTPTPIVSGAQLSTGAYEIIKGCVALPTSTNTNLARESYVDIQIVLPTTGSVVLSDVQVMGQSSQLPEDFVPVPDETLERQLDKEFHYYSNSILYQTKDSILAGWNFPLNPWQFQTTTSTTIASQCSYVTDQTVLYQSTASSVAIGQSTAAADNLSLSVKAVLGTNTFALIQYIDPTTVVPYWTSILSSMVRARLISGGSSSLIKFKMRLIYRSTLPPTLSTTEPITAFDSNGDPIFAAGWTALKPINDPAYVLGTTFDNYSFNGFQLPVNTASTMTLGIVLYTTTNMSASTPDQFILDDVSLIPNSFAMPSNPLTWEQSLSKCQFYYESSYDRFVIPGTATTDSQLLRSPMFVQFISTAFNAFPASFSFEYRTPKRAIPVVHLYSPDAGTVDTASIDLYVNGSGHATNDHSVPTNWNTPYAGTKSIQYEPLTTNNLGAQPGSSTDVNSSSIRFHYTADARLGT